MTQPLPSQVCLFMGSLSLEDVVLPDVLPTNLFNCSFCFLLPKADTFRCSFNSYCNMQALELILCSYTMHVYSPEIFSCSLKRKDSEVRLPWRSDQQLNEKKTPNEFMHIHIHIYMCMLTCVCMCLFTTLTLAKRITGHLGDCVVNKQRLL